MLDIAYYLLEAILNIFIYGLALLLALLFAVALWAMFAIPRWEKQAIAQLAASKCPNCEGVYGFDTAQRAKQSYDKSRAEAQRRHPRSKIYFSKEWSFECPQCQRGSFYHPGTGQLRSVPLFLVGGIPEKEVLLLPPEQLKQLVFAGDWLKIEYDLSHYAAKLSSQGERLRVELPEFHKESESSFGLLHRQFLQLAERLGLTEIEWIIPAPHVVEPQKKPRPCFVRQGFDVLDIPGWGQCFRKVEPVESKSLD